MNRYIALSGVCSRRKADVLIADGRVSVNGTSVTELGTWVQPGSKVEVNGKLISPRPFSYVILNKPAGVLTTTRDDRGRKTVLDLLPTSDDSLASVFPVGRLDRDTRGLLLLTNDGDLAHRLMHPSYEIEKVYLVQTREDVKPHEFDQLKEGITLEDGPAVADQITRIDPNDGTRIALQIHEGRNRQVRRMMQALGHTIVSLERIRYAGLTTEGIRRGKWRRLNPSEIERLYRLAKLK